MGVALGVGVNGSVWAELIWIDLILVCCMACGLWPLSDLDTASDACQISLWLGIEAVRCRLVMAFAAAIGWRWGETHVSELLSALASRYDYSTYTVEGRLGYASHALWQLVRGLQLCLSMAVALRRKVSGPLFMVCESSSMAMSEISQHLLRRIAEAIVDRNIGRSMKQVMIACHLEGIVRLW